jgi:hypothetical protein
MRTHDERVKPVNFKLSHRQHISYFDVIWKSQHQYVNRFDDVFLISEIELFPSLEAVMMDFDKLLLGKAPVKL